MDSAFGQINYVMLNFVNTPGDELDIVTRFKLLETSIDEDGGMEMSITKRAGERWRNW